MSDMKNSRRTFIKGATVAAAGVIAGGLLKSGPADAATAPIDAIVNGISDLHVHADPDVRPRSTDEISLARKARQMGYRSLLFKSHDWSTHDRAYLVRDAVPGFEAFGGISMNQIMGGINVYAAKMTLSTTGNFCRCIWMPTYQSAYDAKVHHGGAAGGIPVCDAAGKVLPEVVKVMEICRDANIVFATGHSAPVEAVALVKKAKEVGVKKCVVTHASSLPWKLSMDQLKECFDHDAFVEHSYIAAIWGPGTAFASYTPTPLEEIAAMIKLNPERTFITSDLGQAMMPAPIDGMRSFITALLKVGFTQELINSIARINPAKLMGLDA